MMRQDLFLSNGKKYKEVFDSYVNGRLTKEKIQEFSKKFNVSTSAIAEYPKKYYVNFASIEEIDMYNDFNLEKDKAQKEKYKYAYDLFIQLELNEKQIREVIKHTSVTYGNFKCQALKYLS